jgi:hypothetical protein
MPKNEHKEGDATNPKPYRLWHVDGWGEFVAMVAEADTVDEIKKVRRRLDWRYQITRNGTPVDETGSPILQAPGQSLTAKE